MRRWMRVIVLLAIFAASCSASPDGAEGGGAVGDLPPVPAYGEGPLAWSVQTELDLIFTDPLFLEVGSIATLGASGDARLGWVLVDLLRFNQFGRTADQIEAALAQLTGVSVARVDAVAPVYRPATAVGGPSAARIPRVQAGRVSDGGSDLGTVLRRGCCTRLA